jgi:predicted methyltransferase MtxX (methanogen marker protein 4)
MGDGTHSVGYSLPDPPGREVRVGVGTAGKASRLEAHLRGEEGIEFFGDAGSMLGSLASGEIQAAVRGEIEASSFLRAARESREAGRLYRVALLSTAGGRPFLFAPVGIDEGDGLDDLRRLVEYGRRLLEELGWPDEVGLLAGGRKEDRGRCPRVDRSIRRAEELAARTGAKLRYILIEEAAEKDRLIIAPDGISGNLVYRTLVHLGGGRSHGAVYLPAGEVMVDTSRAAPLQEYREALKLARCLALRRSGASIRLPLE